MSGQTFRLFACCVPVKGARRSTVCDLQRESYQFIPNGLHEILTKHRNCSIEQIKAAYENRFDQEIDEYFAFLVAGEFGFWTEESELFPDLEMTWETPEGVTNAIVDVGQTSEHNFDTILQQLDDLRCRALQVRYFKTTSLEEIELLLQKTSSGRLRSIDLLLPYSEGWTLDLLESFCVRHARLTNLQIHSSPMVAARRIGESSMISFNKQVVHSAAHCGYVHPAHFVANIEMFTESQHFNSCLNRKISIDEHGDIRNCPALPRSFGNIRDSSLQSALVQQDFRDLWLINKDQIEVCKDCEFRHICTDCRAFIRNADNKFSKPSKCAYDPYTAEWKFQ